MRVLVESLFQEMLEHVIGAQRNRLRIELAHRAQGRKVPILKPVPEPRDESAGLPLERVRMQRAQRQKRTPWCHIVVLIALIKHVDHGVSILRERRRLQLGQRVACQPAHKRIQ